MKNRIDQLAEENEERQQKTLQFTANFMKEEYKAKLKKAMRSQEFLAVEGYVLVKTLAVDIVLHTPRYPLVKFLRYMGLGRLYERNSLTGNKRFANWALAVQDSIKM